MKHTDFHKAFKILEEASRKELAEALKSIGGTFIPDEDNRIVIVGCFKHCCNAEDILLTKVELDGETVQVYGKPIECPEMDEDLIPEHYLEFGYMEWLIDAIPETAHCSDVSLKQRNGTYVSLIAETLLQPKWEDEILS